MSRVLVADDEAPIRDMISMACQLEGHEVAVAYDTASTISMYGEFQPDLLILDLRMPGGGGDLALEQLRFGQGDALCPVIIVSGYVEDARQMKERLGAAAVLTKPVVIDNLRLTIQKILA